MTKRRKPKAPHDKSARYSHTLPEWYRALFHAINPRSSSKALRKLVSYALQNGAAEDLLGIPTAALVDPTMPGSPINVDTIAALVLGSRTPAQQIGGWVSMKKHSQVHGAPTIKPDGSLGWNDGRTPPPPATVYPDDYDGDEPAPQIQHQPPTQIAPVQPQRQPAAPYTGSLMDKPGNQLTEADIAELGRLMFGAPPA